MTGNTTLYQLPQLIDKYYYQLLTSVNRPFLVGQVTSIVDSDIHISLPKVRVEIFTLQCTL